MFLKRASLLLFFVVLIMLSGCSQAGSSSSGQSSPAPATATSLLTPTPTEIPARSVIFSTTDKVQLSGLLYGRGSTMIICSHEFRTSKVIWSVVPVLPLFLERGYQVLAYDFRGNGDSQGADNVGQLDVDLTAALSFARKQGAKKIVLLGSSMGGTASLKVAAHEQVAAVITLSSPQGFGVDVTDADLKAIKVPLLFANSENDQGIDETKHMYQVANQPKELKIYSGAAHGTQLFDGESRDDLTARIINFVTRYAPAN